MSNSVLYKLLGHVSGYNICQLSKNLLVTSEQVKL